MFETLNGNVSSFSLVISCDVRCETNIGIVSEMSDKDLI